MWGWLWLRRWNSHPPTGGSVIQSPSLLFSIHDIMSFQRCVSVLWMVIAPDRQLAFCMVASVTSKASAIREAKSIVYLKCTMLLGEATDWIGMICNYSLQTTRSEFDSSEYEVRRRYQDFLWLRSRLEDNHPTLIVHVCISSRHQLLNTPVLQPRGPVFGWLPRQMSHTINIHSFSHCMFDIFWVFKTG